MLKAEALERKGKARFEPGTNRLYIYRDGEAEMIRLEMAARARREQNAFVEQSIQDSRYSQVSWHGSKRRNVPAFERAAMKPIAPGMVVS